MEISVIICTYNRAESLRRVLDSFTKTVLPGCPWELLLVDNHSTDETKKICQEFETKLPLRYIYEERQGKSFALNRGIAEAKGALLLFTDDDVDVDSRWMSNYWSAACRHPEVVFFGGKVVPQWEVPPPRWLEENQKKLFIVTKLNLGDAEMFCTTGMSFIGANIAFRAKVFGDGFRFSDELGPKGSDSSQTGNVRGEETELQRKLLQGGAKGLYVPSAIVNHHQPARRMTEAYLRRYYRGLGIAEVRANQIPFARPWFNAPRYFWKLLVVSVLKYCATRLSGPSGVWVKAEVDFSFALGIISEFRRLKGAPATSR